MQPTAEELQSTIKLVMSTTEIALLIPEDALQTLLHEIDRTEALRPLLDPTAFLRDGATIATVKPFALGLVYCPKGRWAQCTHVEW